MIDKAKAISVEKQYRIKYGPRLVYLFKCLNPDCDVVVRVRQGALKDATGMCQRHAHVKRPFESIYESLFHDHRKTPVELTYEEFLEFSVITTCHYCGELLPRPAYATVNGAYSSRAHFLDRWATQRITASPVVHNVIECVATNLPMRNFWK